MPYIKSAIQDYKAAFSRHLSQRHLRKMNLEYDKHSVCEEFETIGEPD